MHGGSISSKYQVQQALINKLEIINQLEHTTILTPQLLTEAMQGGMRRLKARFREAATLNVTRNPKMITITGPGEDFQYCPTPDCRQVYHLTSTGETFDHLTCLTPVCMTCEGYKEMDSEDNKLFREYKKEHDVRDCPNCKVGIEKSEACNHIECKNCEAYICWFCMKVFGVFRECIRI